MTRKDRLDSLRVITPCAVPWSSMAGDDTKRFCARCKKNVYNVSQLSRAEALAFVERGEGRVCMQLSWRADGTLATGDCWTLLRRARKRGLLAFAAAAPLIIAAELWSGAFGLRALGEIFNGALEQRVPSAPTITDPLPPGGVGFLPPL